MAHSHELSHPNFQRDSPVSPLQTISRKMSEKEWLESRKKLHAKVKNDRPLSLPPSENLKATVFSAQELLISKKQHELSVGLFQTSKSLHPNFLRDSPLSPIEVTSRKVSEREWLNSHSTDPKSLYSHFQTYDPIQIPPKELFSDALLGKKKETAELEPLLSNFMRDSPLSPVQIMSRKVSMREYIASRQQLHIDSERNCEFLVRQSKNTIRNVRKRSLSEFEQDNLHLLAQSNSQFDSHCQTSSSSSHDASESGSTPCPDGYSPISLISFSPPSPGINPGGADFGNACNNVINKRHLHRGVSDSPISVDSYSPASPAAQLRKVIRTSYANSDSSGDSFRLPKTPLPLRGRPPPRTCIVYRDPESEKALQEHQHARMPQVTEASKRLQELLSVRNDNEFRPPVLQKFLAPDIMGLRNPVNYDLTLRQLKGLIAESRMDTGGFENEKRFKVPLGPACEEQRNLQNQKTVQNFGLRESLFMHGLQPYGKKCRTNLLSLSFHDVTPDMRTGAFRNELMAYFEADKIGRTKLMAYEVETPMPERCLQQGLSIPPATQRWLAFLISTPLINLSDTTTINATLEAFPGNLPNPPPTSWLAFAAPCNKIISYPRYKDSMVVKAAGGHEIVREVQRLDFIFSRDGVPAFEFMDKASVLGTVGVQLQKDVGAPFLCAHGLDRYNPQGDDKDTPGSRLPDGKQDKSVDAAAAIQARVDEDVKKWENRDVNDLAMSKWWQDVEAIASDDAYRWGRIKEAMARGCCRVVARFDQAGSGKGSGIWA